MLSVVFAAICSALCFCVSVLHAIRGAFDFPYWVFVFSYLALVGCIVRTVVLKKDKYLVGCAGFACIFWAFGDFLMLVLTGSFVAKQEIPPIVEWNAFANVAWLVILLLLSVCAFPLAGKCALLYQRKRENPNPNKQFIDGQKGAIGGSLFGALAVGLLHWSESALEPEQSAIILCFALLFLMFCFQTASLGFWVYHKLCKA